MADRYAEPFRYAITTAAAGDQEGSVAGHVLGSEVGEEAGVFLFGEGSCAHVPTDTASGRLAVPSTGSNEVLFCAYLKAKAGDLCRVFGWSRGLAVAVWRELKTPRAEPFPVAAPAP